MRTSLPRCNPDDSVNDTCAASASLVAPGSADNPEDVQEEVDDVKVEVQRGEHILLRRHRVLEHKRRHCFVGGIIFFKDSEQMRNNDKNNNDLRLAMRPVSVACIL